MFHPANALRFFPSGVSPPKEPLRLVAAALPSCRLSVVALPPSRKWVQRRTGLHPRNPPHAFTGLHGFTPLENPLPGPSLFAPTRARAPLGFCLSKVFPSLGDAETFASASLVCLNTPKLRQVSPPFLRACCTAEYRSPRSWPCFSRSRRPFLRFLATCSSSIQRYWARAYFFHLGLQVASPLLATLFGPCAPTGVLRGFG